MYGLLGQLIEGHEEEVVIDDQTTGGGLIHAFDPVAPIVTYSCPDGKGGMTTSSAPCPHPTPHSLPPAQTGSFMDWLQHSTIDIFGVKIPSYLGIAAVVVGALAYSGGKRGR